MADLLQVLRDAGFSGQSLDTAYAIAMAESGGNAGAFNGNRRTGDQSYGLFQINMLGGMGPERRKQFGISSNDALLDPATNAKIAYQMSNGGKDWTPWSTFNNDTYRQYLGKSGAQTVGDSTIPPADPAGAQGSADIIGSNLGPDFAPAINDPAPGVQDPAQPTQDVAPSTTDAGAASTAAAKYAGGATDFRDKVVTNAMRFLGTRYSWGGGTKTGTSTGIRGAEYDGTGINGLDCSGLMLAAFGLAGFDMQRVARQQLASGDRASISSLRPGDLIGYGNGYHVAMYIGDGHVIDSLPGKGVTVRAIGDWERREGWGVRMHLPGD
jgi:cell wall-associated NlpC family hydrolase